MSAIMKYLLTVIAAVFFGTASFNLVELFNFRRWQERLLIFLAATLAAARMCAGAWM
jgi:hypothetical protein